MDAGSSDLFQRDRRIPVVEVAEPLDLFEVFGIAISHRLGERARDPQEMKWGYADTELVAERTVAGDLAGEAGLVVGTWVEGMGRGSVAGLHLHDSFSFAFDAIEVADQDVAQGVLEAHLVPFEEEVFGAEELHDGVVDLHQPVSVHLHQSVPQRGQLLDDTVVQPLRDRGQQRGEVSRKLVGRRTHPLPSERSYESCGQRAHCLSSVPTRFVRFLVKEYRRSP